jgi:hypothetical protein
MRRLSALLRLFACLFPGSAPGGSFARAPTEDFGVSGPYFPSASFAATAVRPRLVVTYAVLTTGLSP